MLRLNAMKESIIEITISNHSSGVKTLHCHFMYKNLNSKSCVSRCKCVSCFDTILVVNPEEWFSRDAAQNSWVLVFRSALMLFSIHCLYDIRICS